MLLDQFTNTPLMYRIGVAVQEAHRHTFNPLGHQRMDRGKHLRFIQRSQYFAGSIHTLCNAETPMARHQRSGLLQEHVVLRKPVFQPNFHQIAKPFRCKQCGSRPLALNECIGGERGSQNQGVHFSPPQPRLFQQRFNTAQYRQLWRLRRGENLGCELLATSPQQHEIGESAAHIHR